LIRRSGTLAAAAAIADSGSSNAVAAKPTWPRIIARVSA
jgi:hypothetical protein